MSDQWAHLCETLARASSLVEDADPPCTDLERETGYRYLLNVLNSGLELLAMNDDPGRPEIGRPQDPARRWALDCPDALYGYAPVAAGGEYVLRGRPRGRRPHYLALSVMTGQWGGIAIAEAAKLSAPGDLVFEPDGSFEVRLGGAASSGNWLPLPDGAIGLAIRQFLYDWDTEDPLELTIECLSPPAARSEDDAIKQLDAFVAGSVQTWAAFTDFRRSAGPNTIASPQVGGSEYGGTVDNAYGGGWFELGPDEAAIITVRPPVCHYWNIQFGDRWMQSLDYTYRQTALNGHQAVLDDDGAFVGVLAHDDPGIANWFDTAGHRYLTMGDRWQRAVGDLPPPEVRVVPFVELDDHVAPSVPRVTPDERADSLARRRRAVLRRYGRGW